MKAKISISLIILALLLAGCGSNMPGPSTTITTDPTTDACKISIVDTKTLTPSPGTYNLVIARATLVGFFDALNGGWYDEAATQYGGSYEALIELNPDINPDDHSALLERACTENGFQCLRVRQILRQAQVFPDTYTFSVEFAKPDGNPLEFNACCGEDLASTRPRSAFEITVMQVPQAGNAYRVQGLPVYIP